MNTKSLINTLQLLINENAVSCSRFSKSQQNVLNELARRTQLINLIKKGRGFTYQVVDLTAIQNYLRQLQPLTASDVSLDLPPRSLGIALYKNSKQHYNPHSYYYALMKAVGDEVYWYNTVIKINSSEQTNLQGLTALLFIERDAWFSQHELFLVENQALFDDLSWLPDDFKGTVIYYGGYLHSVLLNWLAFKTRATKFWLFADYDAVGLHNYLKLYRCLGKCCQFYFMPHWREKLDLFANNTIWQENSSLFDKTVQALTHTDALSSELIDLIQRTRSSGACLEQEAIFITL